MTSPSGESLRFGIITSVRLVSTLTWCCPLNRATGGSLEPPDPGDWRPFPRLTYFLAVLPRGYCPALPGVDFQILLLPPPSHDGLIKFCSGAPVLLRSVRLVRQ
jgi:hypothetical protein